MNKTINKVSYTTIKNNKMLEGFPEGTGTLTLEEAKSELANVRNGQEILRVRKERLLSDISKLQREKEREQQDRGEEVRATAIQQGVPQDHDGEVCRCGRSKEAGERLCLRCEELEFDAVMDAVAESKEATK